MNIDFQGVAKVYNSTNAVHHVLKHIDFTISSGEFVGILGKSGCGKTTLLNMMTGIDTPTSGIVRIGGTDLSQLKRSRLERFRGRNIGIVFQFFQLLPTLNLFENVLLPMDFSGVYSYRERNRRAYELLEQVEMSEHARKLPMEVSGGQQQRAAIARSLANDPSIIVADEPTGNLDSQTVETIFRLFESLVSSRKKTVVVVTHDTDLASRIPRIFRMADGNIVRTDEPHA